MVRIRVQPLMHILLSSQMHVKPESATPYYKGIAAFNDDYQESDIFLVYNGDVTLIPLSPALKKMDDLLTKTFPR
ncbi:MAG: hypothetical protein RQ801_08945 [Spirochaetaceae bacterium]|nr:hypothetical protein [Spirochaetaceae bacterium]MDT8298412.1 hypothetical protein [Spirochaetaceae bacterium]